MKFVISISLLFFALTAFCDLPILNTSFHKEPLEAVQSHARQNQPEAQLELALRYYAGYQVERDPRLAFEWMSRAAGQENADAQFLLSRMYAEGVGTEEDREQSEAWFAKAIAADPQNKMLIEHYEVIIEGKEDDSTAKNKFLKVCSDAGYLPAEAALREPEALEMCARGNYRAAVGVFQELADQNSPAGMCRLADMYAKGLGGLPEDFVEAFDLYSKSAGAGYAEAQFALASMYEDGIGVDRDLVMAAKWYEKAARNGVADALCKVGDAEFASAVRWFGKASLTPDDEMAQFDSMKHYKRDLSSAIASYRKAAAGGSAGAQYMLGRLHASGEGVVKDFDQALEFYKQAAGQNHADALFYIGLMYHAGLGISPNAEKAIFFYQKAAERGSRAAMFYLGNCHFFGYGVEQHARKGTEFYRDALQDVSVDSEDSTLLNDIWVFRAAREYAVILWRKAAVENDAALAVKWMSLAARSGDSFAREMLVEMMSGNRSFSGVGDGVADIAGAAVDPRKDAGAKRRDVLFLFPYLQQDVREIYPGFDPPHVITTVMARGETRSVTGGSLWELAVKYRRPDARRTVGLRGILLVGAEFEDTETGETFWAYNKIEDNGPVFSGETFIDASLFVDIGGHSNLRLGNWTVTYGHLPDRNRRLLAVIDEQKKSKSAGTIEEMASRNRFTVELDSRIITTIDIDAKFPGGIEDPNGGGDSGSDDDNGLLDSILGTVTGG
ncbi:tetratricopeptide repeat protein [Tichowtungia aerotolerans]|uniref:Sel1 repeat family protein n=1 Tax=Tichowtungia aerotolerans TaxID=2697043 RepID=A0A6P1M7N5_9BACT|nr:tetratricopeptide repeat protein [Tichowtungia aerotolerans]QHI69877.1 hypothetical protein GT409_10575 [Tichowtungia aerotolerans]